MAQRTDDTDLERKARVLLDAAQDYWNEMQKTPSMRGALFWLDDTGGRTLIFTRSEYRTTLLSNIDFKLNDVRKQFTHLQTGYFNDADGITDEDLSKPRG
jgi:hypothetical protein